MKGPLRQILLPPRFIESCKRCPRQQPAGLSFNGCLVLEFALFPALLSLIKAPQAQASRQEFWVIGHGLLEVLLSSMEFSCLLFQQAERQICFRFSVLRLDRL